MGTDEPALRRMFSDAVIEYCETHSGLCMENANGLLFVFQVEPKHLFGLVGNFDFFWDAGGPPAKIIDLSSKEDCVIEFFRSMAFEFGGDIIKSGAFDCLTIDRVGDNGLLLER